MRSRQIRLLIALVAALFLMNNVAVAARALSIVMSGQHGVVIHESDGPGVGHPQPADNVLTLCVTHCAQSTQLHEQDLATNVVKVGFLPALSPSYLPVEFKPVARGSGLAPQAAGPPFTVLFHNFRN